MSIDYIILGLLREPLSGYDIKRYFDNMISHFWAAEQSQIYRSLKKLEQADLITCSVEPSDKGPDRKVYSITPNGTDSLHNWLRNEPLIGDERNAYTAQLCFMGDLEDPQQTLVFLLQLSDKMKEKLALLLAVDRSFRQSNPDYPDRLPWRDYHFALTLNLGINMMQARVSWCEQAIRDLEARLGIQQGDNR